MADGGGVLKREITTLFEGIAGMPCSPSSGAVHTLDCDVPSWSPPPFEMVQQAPSTYLEKPRPLGGQEFHGFDTEVASREALCLQNVIWTMPTNIHTRANMISCHLSMTKRKPCVQWGNQECLRPKGCPELQPGWLTGCTKQQMLLNCRSYLSDTVELFIVVCGIVSHTHTHTHTHKLLLRLFWGPGHSAM